MHFISTLLFCAAAVVSAAPAPQFGYTAGAPQAQQVQEEGSPGPQVCPFRISLGQGKYLTNAGQNSRLTATTDYNSATSWALDGSGGRLKVNSADLIVSRITKGKGNPAGIYSLAAGSSWEVSANYVVTCQKQYGGLVCFAGGQQVQFYICNRGYGTTDWVYLRASYQLNYDTSLTCQGPIQAQAVGGC